MTAKISLDKKNDIKCDPGLLFQRLLLATPTNPVDKDDFLSYELAAFPLSLFETSTFLRKANKPNLAEGIVKLVKRNSDSNLNGSNDPTSDSNNVNTVDQSNGISNTIPIGSSIQQNHQYVLDGGSLLHRITWTKGNTYGEIGTSCSKFVFSCYGQAVVIFGGYGSSPSTKDMKHLRHFEKRHPREVFFFEDTVSSLSKEDFLSHAQNKAKFVSLIGKKLEQIGCRVIYSTDDADRDIALTSVHESLKTLQ